MGKNELSSRRLVIDNERTNPLDLGTKENILQQLSTGKRLYAVHTNAVCCFWFKSQTYCVGALGKGWARTAKAAWKKSGGKGEEREGRCCKLSSDIGNIT